MSRLDELIEQYCPDGVEWKTLGEVFETITDYTAAGSFKNIADNVQYLKMPDYAMLIRTTDLKSNFTKGGFIYVSQSAFNYLWRVNMNKECIVMPNVGNCGEIYYVQPQDLPYEHCALAPNAILVRSNAHNNRYLSYCLQVEDFQRQLNKITSPVGQSKFNKTELKKLVIPVPPLPVQEEIVRILDTFTELQAELQAELQKRKQQYNYYCNKLLNHFPENNDVTEYFVGQLASFSYGYTSKAEDNGPIRYIRITDINEKGFLNPDNAKFIPYSQDVKPYILNKNDIVMARTGATFGKTLLFNEDYPAAYASFLIKISLSNKVNPRYYWHFSKSSKYWEQANRLVGGGAQPQFNTKAIAQIKIMLPPLEEQQRIVAILDRFDTLTNDLTSGLPAEIEKRRQQYEFYRDKLLTFKRKEA